MDDHIYSTIKSKQIAHENKIENNNHHASDFKRLWE